MGYPDPATLIVERLRLARSAMALALVAAVSGVPEALAGSSASVAVTANPGQVGLRLTPATTKVGGAIGATETVTNLGTSGLSNLRYSLLVDAAALKVTGPMGGSTSLAGHAQSRARFDICAMKAGAYLIQARVTATGAAGQQFTAVTAAQLVEVRPSNTKSPCR